MPVDPVLMEYANAAGQYDNRWRHYTRRSVQETLRRLPLQPGDRLLDVGCGTGTLLEQLARVPTPLVLTGVDPSHEMLAVARSKLESSVSLVEARAEQLPFADESFNVVVSTSVFHFVSQPERALSEMHRVLRPGARFLLTDWCDDFVACRVCDWYLRLFNRSYHRMYGTRDCRNLLAAQGLQAIDVGRYKISWIWGLMTARAVKGDSNEGVP